MISSKTLAIIFSVAVTGLLLWPITENFKQAPIDRFPLSYYPMFSHARGTDHTLVYVLGWDEENNRYYLPYNYIGSGGFNQVRRQLNKTVRKKTGDALLKKIETRIQKKDSGLYQRLVRIEIARGTFDFNTYYQLKNKVPAKETVLYTKTKTDL